MNETLSPRIDNLTSSPAPSVPVVPKFIKVVITEEDRQNAADYIYGNACLVCTALKRSGYKDVQVYAYHVRISGRYYNFDFGCGLADNISPGISPTQKPFYPASVVGKVISATLAE